MTPESVPLFEDWIALWKRGGLAGMAVAAAGLEDCTSATVGAGESEPDEPSPHAARESKHARAEVRQGGASHGDDGRKCVTAKNRRQHAIVGGSAVTVARI